MKIPSHFKTKHIIAGLLLIIGIISVFVLKQPGALPLIAAGLGVLAGVAVSVWILNKFSKK